MTVLPRNSVAVLESNEGVTNGRHCWLVQQCDSIQKKTSRITIISDHLFPSFRRKPESSLFNMFWTPAPAPDFDPGFAGVTQVNRPLLLSNTIIEYWHRQESTGVLAFNLG